MSRFMLITLLVFLAKAMIAQECSDLLKCMKEKSNEGCIKLVEQINYFECRDEDGKTPIFYASKDILLELIKKGANVNAETTVPDPLAVDGEGEKGITPLIDAAFWGDLERVKILVEYGANIDAQSSFGITALMKACQMDHLEVAKYLIEKGANIELKNDAGENTLLFSMNSSREKLKLVDYLLSKGFAPNSRDNGGETALMWAVKWGHHETVRLLISKGAEVNLKEKITGRTALMKASQSYHPNLEIIKLLLKSGAKIDLSDISGKSAYFYALENGNFEIADLLEEFGADVVPHNRICKKILKEAKKKGYINLKERNGKSKNEGL